MPVSDLEQKLLLFDPGPDHCGVVVLDTHRRWVEFADASMCLEAALRLAHTAEVDLVVIERVASYGISGASLLETSEVVGRLQQAAELGGRSVELIYRRQVISALSATGRGTKDSLVRQALLQTFAGWHGLTVKDAIGRKKTPGPLHGVSKHAWSALAVGTAWMFRHRLPPMSRCPSCRRSPVACGCGDQVPGRLVA